MHIKKILNSIYKHGYQKRQTEMEHGNRGREREGQGCRSIETDLNSMFWPLEPNISTKLFLSEERETIIYRNSRDVHRTSAKHIKLD